MQDQSSTESILDLYTNPGNAMDSLATLASTTLIAEVIAPIFFFLSLAYMFVNTFIKEGHRGKFIQPGEIKRLIIVMILIPVVPVLFLFIQKIGSVTAKQIEMDAGDKFSAITNLWDQMNASPEEEFSIFFLTMSIVYKLLAMVFMVIAILLMYMVKFIVLLFSGVFVQFCIIVSPLAMAFSILPIFKEQVEKLLAIFFNACFVGLTMNILDNMFFDSLFAKVITALNDPAADIFNYMIVAATCFTIVIFYLLAFWLTSKYVGMPGAAAIMSTAVTATTMAVMSAANLFGGVGSAGGASTGPSSPEANVINSAARSIRKEE
ncbi:hypothetical protein [uncultured Flavobacterium sp.]|uniref:hypothetical protein n=1 Tax=uncultured Flavobacterium sp. TaxID=165435 RepID=UPI002591B50F|nr:hypothetical protein [uncultured Flavobacterium sp.]